MALIKNAWIRFLGILSVFLLLSSDSFASGIAWSAPTAISTPNQNASNPQIGVDSNGNVVALWIEFGFIKSSNRPVNGSWSPPQIISGSGASAPILVVDLNGNATAIWIESGMINTAYKSFSGGWGAASVLSGSGASAPRIAQDRTGNVVAVWVLNGVIQSATRLFGGSWPINPDTISNTGMDSPQVAIGANGNVVAVWHGVASSMNTIFAANKSISGSWNTSQPISTSAFHCINPKIAVDLNGNATAVWFRYEVANTVYSNVVFQATTCPYGNSWATPLDLSQPGFYNPSQLVTQIYYDGSGDAVAAWNTSFDGSTFAYEVALLPVNEKWGFPMDLVAQNLFAYAVDLSVDTLGHAFAVYMLYNPSQASTVINYRKIDIFAFKPGWCTLFNSLSQGAYNGFPIVEAVSNGNQTYMAAAWLSYDGANTQVIASIGAGTMLAPPTNLSVVQSSNNNNIFTEYYNTLSWQANADPKVQGYYVFRNGQYINNVPANITQIIDDNRNPSESVTYGVAAYSADYSQSQVVTITYP